MEVPMTEAATNLGIAHQTLTYYVKSGRVTGRKIGERVVLIDPVVAKAQLEQAGFYRRRANRRRNKQKKM